MVMGALDQNALRATAIDAWSQEILEMVFEYVHDASPSTLTSLTRVSRRFYASAYPIKYRHQPFAFAAVGEYEHAKRGIEALRSLLTDYSMNRILLSIRYISIMPVPLSLIRMGPHPVHESEDEKWLLMVNLLSKVPHLKEFTLNGRDQLPVSVLRALAKYHPQARLHIQNWTRLKSGDDHNNDAEIALAHSPNLRSIQAHLGPTFSSIDLRRVALERIMAMSPRLDHVDISQVPNQGVSWGAARDTNKEEHARMEEEFRSTIVGSSTSIRSLRSRFHQLTLFEHALDLTKLRTLDVGYLEGDINSLISQWQPEKFPLLRNLSFALSDSVDAQLYGLSSLFLQGCSPLASLSITDGANLIPLSAIAVHGATLHKLVLHEVERSVSYAPSMSVAELRSLGQSCRVLQDITLDAGDAIAGPTFDEILSALATFPLLDTIRVYIRIGVAEEAARTPHVFLDHQETSLEMETHKTKPLSLIKDSSWLEKMWSLLRREKKWNGTKPLQELHVKVGEWERDVELGYPAGWLVWEASHRRYFRVTPHERDDRPDDINVCVGRKLFYDEVNSHEIRRIPDLTDSCDCSEPSSSRGTNYKAMTKENNVLCDPWLGTA